MDKQFETTFETTGPINLKVELLAGDAKLTATDRTTTEVRLIPHGRNGVEFAERFTVEARGNDVVVLAPKKEGLFGFSKGSVDVEIDLPAGSTIDVRTGSGDIAARGLLGDVRVGTGSGDIAIEELAEGDLKSGSGDITAHVVRGGLQAKTGSGDISVDTGNAPLELTSGSGDLFVRRAEARLKAKTGSGNITVRASAGDIELTTGTGEVNLAGVHSGRVQARTGTGDVTIGIANGVAAYLDLNTVTGEVDVDLDGTDGPGDAEAQTSLSVQSGSGDIHVKKAQVSLA